jgi:stage V sporulation protein S
LIDCQRLIIGQWTKVNAGGRTNMQPTIQTQSIEHNGRHSSHFMVGGNHMAELIKVSSQSRSTAVAGAIAGVMREHGYAEVQAIGASALNQAIKAVTIARGYLVQDGFDLVIVPEFTEVQIEGLERTAVRMAVFKRPNTLAAPEITAAAIG